MKRINIDDMDVAMTFKTKGNSRRYAFADYSDRINLENSVAKILKNRRKRNNNQTKKQHMGKPMAGAEALLKMKATMRKPQLVMTYKDTDNVRCNMTHIFIPTRNNRWIVIEGIITLSQAKRECPGLTELFYSKNGEEYGNMYAVVGNVH